MFGLRPEIDQHNLSKLSSFNSNGYKRSARFANTLSGRFFVSGISGSLAKHTKLLKELNEKKEALKTQENEVNYLQRKQKEELHKDALALIAMEEKLQEVYKHTDQFCSLNLILDQTCILL